MPDSCARVFSTPNRSSHGAGQGARHGGHGSAVHPVHEPDSVTGAALAAPVTSAEAVARPEREMAGGDPQRSTRSARGRYVSPRKLGGPPQRGHLFRVGITPPTAPSTTSRRAHLLRRRRYLRSPLVFEA